MSTLSRARQAFRDAMESQLKQHPHEHEAEGERVNPPENEKGLGVRRGRVCDSRGDRQRAGSPTM
jgi:hypothetical protein